MYKKPMISVIVPVYNLEKYVRQTIKSILQQNYRNFEVIIVNDGSTDNSLSILQELKKNDPRILIFNQVNQGQAVARNLGISHANGDYITFIDGDDIVQKNYLKIMIEYALKHQDVDLVNLPYQNVSVDKISSIGKEQRSYQSFEFSSEVFLKKVLQKNNREFNVSLYSKLFKQTLFKKFRIPEGHYYEDLAGVPELIRMTDKIAWIDDVEYAYIYNRPRSTVNSLNQDKAVDIIWALNRLANFFYDTIFEDSFSVLVLNNIYYPFYLLRNNRKYLSQINQMLKRISPLHLLIKFPKLHISKKGILVYLWCAIRSFR
ncbi:glycosyltransferase family 2 protein [Lentilactobacillus buchneri]|uniref:glycosyltransferase family 2 protein n=1 Tax=Lentilactobacillus buchneri TaxID=1581 RepID=UPI0011932962|nr:glycosyltransferase family 2 protein [Lentilactobacillus buchneri]MCT3252079.1 glycosyltransferase [Lentilactobacillus buchneri]MCT3546668.1 glycosyltransferase [Lentilactobacillus buchneri]MCT4437261.1 glycosyltransferase [Lentilactobacillus buchneri]GEP15079.1 glycosyl transferase [Lentilactobacillus buchneri]